MRNNLSGVTGLDFNVYIPVIEAKGWRLDLSLVLLSEIEHVMFGGEPTD